MKIRDEDMYYGDLYRCVRMPSAMANYFIGYGYEEKLFQEKCLFLKLKNGMYVGVSDYQQYGKGAMRFGTEPKEAGDFFVKNLVPFLENQGEPNCQ